jgi:hypothetical protein
MSVIARLLVAHPSAVVPSDATAVLHDLVCAPVVPAGPAEAGRHVALPSPHLTQARAVARSG